MCTSHMLSAVTHTYIHTHTHTCTYTCVRTHSDLQWNIQMVFPLSFSPGIFEGLAHIFSRLFSFLFYISNARISNFNFASISIHKTQIHSNTITLKLLEKIYLIAIKYNYNVFDRTLPHTTPHPGQCFSSECGEGDERNISKPVNKNLIPGTLN